MFQKADHRQSRFLKNVDFKGHLENSTARQYADGLQWYFRLGRKKIPDAQFHRITTTIVIGYFLQVQMGHKSFNIVYSRDNMPTFQQIDHLASAERIQYVIWGQAHLNVTVCDKNKLPTRPTYSFSGSNSWGSSSHNMSNHDKMYQSRLHCLNKVKMM